MRPDIPKNMDLRIRTAQAKILRARDYIVHVEQCIVEETAELAFFERDPHGWIFRRWRRAFELDSYPVVTASTRLRDYLNHRKNRRSHRAIELEDLESRLMEIEREVLAKVGTMRPGAGRVPWPAPLPPFHGYESVLVTGAAVRRHAQEYEAELMAESAAKNQEQNDDGASPGEGDIRAMQTRALAWDSPNRLVEGRIRLQNGTSFHVTAAGKAEIELLQVAIDADQSGGVVGKTWNLACAILLSGCNWTGWDEWYRRLVSPLGNLVAQPIELLPGMSMEAAKLARNQRYDEVLAMLRRSWLPDNLGNLVTFIAGDPVSPFVLYDFWRSAGFSDKIARNWFLNTQAHTLVFQESMNSYGRETWNAMNHAGLVVQGLEIPLVRAISEFNLSALQPIMADLGMAKCLRISDCHAALLAHPDENGIKERLRPYGYDRLVGVEPPPGLSWQELQSWRQQIRGMAGAITDLFVGSPPVPLDVQKLLLK